jgi:hypothetical protein
VNSDRHYGEFAELGEEGGYADGDDINNGIRSRAPKSHYVRLGEPAEMQSLSPNRESHIAGV